MSSYGKSNYSDNATEASYSFPRSCAMPPDLCSVEVQAQNGDGKVKSDITYWHLISIGK